MPAHAVHFFCHCCCATAEHSSLRAVACLQGYMNLLDFFGVYGTICKETGTAFRWALPLHRAVVSN